MNAPLPEEQDPERVQREFVRHERHLWGIAYRMLGVPADADDAVQEAFVRLLRSPPPDLGRSLRPWLVRVTVNLCRDQLRRRQASPYKGSWLPGPIDTEDRVLDPPAGTPNPEARYDVIESLSLGFLLTAEKCTPTQRAVVVLRDVFGYSVRETAAALELTEANVKTTLHRARKVMLQWEDRQRRNLTVPHDRIIEAMGRFFAAVLAGDLAAAEACLADDVVVLNDGGGEFFAARSAVHGAGKAALFHVKIARRTQAVLGMRNAVLNGLPAIIVDRAQEDVRDAPRTVTQLELDASGRITRIYSVLASHKLTGLVDAVG